MAIVSAEQSWVHGGHGGELAVHELGGGLLVVLRPGRMVLGVLLVVLVGRKLFGSGRSW